MMRGFEANASRYSGNVSHDQLDALVQRGAGDVFDALHQLHEEVVTIGTHRCEADAAVAEDRRRDAMPARRCELVVPGRLTVVVRVRIDEARRHERAVGVEDFARGAAERADLDDDTVGDGDVGAVCGCAGAVDDHAALQQKVVHGITS